MSRDRRTFLRDAATGSLGLLLSCSRSPALRPPNIIYIMADDLGYGELGCYGQTRIRTPNIDRLATEGMRFTDAYAGCTVCAPSRSVLMTGHHMGHTSVRANTGGVPLEDTDVTVAELLQQSGYATGCFGKWGLGDIGTDGVPWKQGFDQFCGYLHQAHAHYFYPHYIYENDQQLPLPGNEGDGRGTYSHDVIADPDKFSEMESLTGQTLAPCLRVRVADGDDLILPDFGPEELEAFVAEHGLSA